MAVGVPGLRVEPGSGVQVRRAQRAQNGERGEHEHRQADRYPSHQLQAPPAEVAQQAGGDQDDDVAVRGHEPVRLVVQGRAPHAVGVHLQRDLAEGVLEVGDEEGGVDRVVDGPADQRQEALQEPAGRPEGRVDPGDVPRVVGEGRRELRGQQRLRQGPDYREQDEADEGVEGPGSADRLLAAEGPARDVVEDEHHQAQAAELFAHGGVAGPLGLAPRGRALHSLASLPAHPAACSRRAGGRG
mmetsp:Transcript_61803/g.174145  ORF Transcript_61803/g.174145 Transcript_61803/m.174145 type:complete len:243 (+) Transcript_61803:796-1524(+)